MSRKTTVHATPAEAHRMLPGDELIADPLASYTHAVTVHCPPREVWPWLAQMGADRAGWYSYDLVDNGGRPSAEEIVPQFQHVEAGDLFPWLPDATDGFVVAAVDPGRHLVLSALDPQRTPIVTWAFVLEPGPDALSTRLLVRVRGSHAYQFHGLPQWVVKRIVPAGHYVMQRKQLLGIARRAEHSATGRLPQLSTTLL